VHPAEHLSDERLTPRELDVPAQIAEGNRNSDIAAKLFVAEGTVKVHVKNIMQKLGATDRTHAVTIAVSPGIIQL
jgi:DNA-binding NarL/FixJ family response regulator